MSAIEWEGASGILHPACPLAVRREAVLCLCARQEGRAVLTAGVMDGGGACTGRER